MTSSEHRQRGVVLMMTLVMLVIVSLLATVTMKNALSNESASGNVRLYQLAHQSAEAALRFCEKAAVDAINGAPSGLTVQDYSTSGLLGSSVTAWDNSSSTARYSLNLSIVNDGGKPYKRPPECIAERLVPNTSPKKDDLIVVTARGFGPDVAAVGSGATTRRPSGSEVFLQSTLELN